MHKSTDGRFRCSRIVVSSYLWSLVGKVTYAQGELAVFDPTSGQSCQQYLTQYLTTTNPGANRSI